MSLFLVFVAIALIGAVVLLSTNVLPRIFGTGRAGSPLVDGLDDPVPSLPPVLLPERAEPADIDKLRFAIGFRGYRMDQVDQVLDELRSQLAARDLEISQVREELSRRPPAGRK